MLARDHRLRSSDEIREVVKLGKRVSNQFATIHYLPSDSNQFAVVTSKAIGNAVVRNKVRRRTKAALFELQKTTPGIKAVIRLRPESAIANWESLSKGIKDLFGRVK
jgi:ribonuclease P protein component